MPNMKKYAKPVNIVQALLPETRELKTTLNRDERGEKKSIEKLRGEYAEGTEITTPVYYSALKYSTLNEYDIIARHILAVVYSSGNKGEKSDYLYQQLIGMPTVAVASLAGKIHVACDKIEIQKKSIEHIILSAGYIDFEIIKNNQGNRKLHAEMKIIQALGNKVDGKFMGVSKPCCFQCADFLESQGVDYSYWHSQNVGIWTAPF